MKLIDRPLYLNKILKHKNNRTITALTGVRNTGKSILLKNFYQRLIDSGVISDNIIQINLESAQFNYMTTGAELYDFIKSSISGNDKIYLLIDEIQRLKNWQSALVSLSNEFEFEIDIYITSSGNLPNENLNQPINLQEIQILPMSFKEYLKFNNLSIESAQDNLNDYMINGGMFANENAVRNLFFSTLAQDVFAVNKIADAELMMSLIKILILEMGNIISFNSISKKLAANDKKPSAVQTIELYIKMLINAKLFYAVPVFDVISGSNLVRYAKYYPVDLSFCNLFTNVEHLRKIKILENIVYFELLRLGVKVTACRIGKKNTVFLAETEDNKIYIQVTDTLTKLHYKLSPLHSIKNHYSKWIITLDEEPLQFNEGIRIINIIDFLLDE